MSTLLTWIRFGPVYLWWSEWNEAAEIGPSKGAWGGDDIYRCDRCPDWQSGCTDEHIANEETVHAALHGFYA